MMGREAYRDLLEAIKQRGLRKPIVLLDGMILDGRNRYKACVEAGIQPRFIEFDPEESPWLFVWDENAERRHLAEGTKAAIWLKVEEKDEEWKAEKQRIEDAGSAALTRAKSNNKCSRGTPVVRKRRGRPTRNARAKRAKTSTGTMAKVETLKANAPDLYAKVLAGKLSAAAGYKAWQSRKRAKQEAKAMATAPQNRVAAVVECCDFREFIRKAKFDVVITDPPYPKEFMHLYGELAKECAAKKVRCLAAMAGQSYLEEILPMMARHMRYRWTISYLTPGGQSVQIFDRKVNTFWKPVLVFGENPEEWLGDVAKSAVNDNEKAFHEWGQSDSGMLDLVKKLSKPGEIVCDPFVGGGATALAALSCGRGFCGCDNDPAQVKTTRERIGS